MPLGRFSLWPYGFRRMIHIDMPHGRGAPDGGAARRMAVWPASPAAPPRSIRHMFAGPAVA